MVNKGVATAVALLAVMVGLNMSGVVTIDVLKDSLKQNRDALVKMGLQGNLLMVGVDILFIVCFFPGSFFLELFCGFIYGVQLGAATILVGKTTAAAICFLLGRTLLKDAVTNMVKSNKAFRKFYEASSASGWQLVLAGRLSPVPSYMCNYGFSATNVSFHDYMLATFLASFPMVVQNTYMGSMAKNIGDVFSGAVVSNGDSIVTQIFKFGFPFIGTALIVLWAKSFLSKLADDAETGRLADSRQTSPARMEKRTTSPSARQPAKSSMAAPKSTPRARARSKSPAPAKSPARGRSPTARKTPIKSSAKSPAKSARSPSPRRTRATPRK